MTFEIVKVLPGCGCCEVNGKLVQDKHAWIVEGKTYGIRNYKVNVNVNTIFSECCRGEIVVRQETQETEGPTTIDATTIKAPITTKAPSTTNSPITTKALTTTEAPRTNNN